MAIGQVSFHSDKKIKRGGSKAMTTFSVVLHVETPLIWPVHVTTRDNAIVNRMNKTKVEREVDHEAERQARLKEEGRTKKAEATERVSRRTFYVSCARRC
jgi:hypothetical protein